MSYVVQVRWPDGRWTYVMDSQAEIVRTYGTREAAEVMAAAWRKVGTEDAVRVVEVEGE